MNRYSIDIKVIGYINVCVEDIHGRCLAQILNFGDNKHAATRRAIFMAAAEMGKAKGEG